MSPMAAPQDPPETAAPAFNLAYVALACRDADRTATFLGDHLGLSAFGVSLPSGEAARAFRVGETALIVLEQGHAFLSEGAGGVDHIAIAADEPAKACIATGLKMKNADSGGLNNQTQAALERSEACGVSVRYAPPLNLPPLNQEVVTRIDHLGIASGDNILAEDVFCRRIGATYESRQTDMEIATAIESFTSDKYGAVYHTRRPEPVGGLRVSFLTLGDLELEFLQNFDPSQGFEIRHGAAGNTKQDQSAIGRFVVTRGGGLHHVAFKVTDIDETLAKMSAHGHQTIDAVGRPGSRRARIGFMHPSSTGGVLFHFVEREEING